jgi:hypothetical protein
LDAKLLGCHIRAVAEASPAWAPVSRLHHPILRDILNDPTAEATRAFSGNPRTGAVAGRRSRRQRRAETVPMLLPVVGRPAAEADAFAEAQVGPRLGLFEAAQRVEEIHPLSGELFLTAKTRQRSPTWQRPENQTFAR